VGRAARSLNDCRAVSVVLEPQYCSKKCYGVACVARQKATRKPKIKLVCDWCKQEFERKASVHASWERRGSDGTYCSVSCSNSAKATKNLVVNYETERRNVLRHQMIRCGKLVECERCGYSKNRNILQIHHKDRNTKHNDPSNLEILCPNCHAEEHYGEGRDYFKRRD
jgi:5-methylcytosine-specific restriction endonuclease McrA